jgi:class 3 adenylate cyclase
MSNIPRQIAIVFADVSGSTSLYERLGDHDARIAIETVLTALRKSIAIHDGRVVKTIGDEIMAALPSADAAIQAACDMQIRVSAIPPVSGMKLAIRIGFHFGPAIEKEGDFFGDAVNVAARMAGLAKGRQIITSGSTVDALSPLLRKSTRDLDTMAIKGKQDEVRIAEVLWQDSEDVTTLAPRESRADMQEPTLTLTYGSASLKLGAARTKASLGRDVTNDLAVADKMASRVHATIEYRRGQFLLEDQSTNGTFVKVDGDAEVVLKRDKILLRGRGVICLGHSAAAPGSEAVVFAIG